MKAIMFPAYAGMNRGYVAYHRGIVDVPRICGDEPPCEMFIKVYK